MYNEDYHLQGVGHCVGLHDICTFFFWKNISFGEGRGEGGGHGGNIVLFTQKTFNIRLSLSDSAFQLVLQRPPTKTTTLVYH